MAKKTATTITAPAAWIVNSNDRGIIPRALEYLFDIIRHLNDIYKCNCVTCIQKRSAYELIDFYNFITIHKNMIINDAK
jgi:hypothetical protein